MDWRFWRRWTVIVTAGEMVGFVAPAVAGATLATLSVSPALTFSVMLLAGAVEGWCLGYAQAWALRRQAPELPRSSFAWATAAGAVLAYAMGMLPSTLGDRLYLLRTEELLLDGAAVGMVLLASIGGAQWLVLRRHGLGRLWWIVATAAAWAAGLFVFMLVATPLWHTGQPLWLTIAIGVFAGTLMAFTAAALTGLAAVGLVQRRPD